MATSLGERLVYDVLPKEYDGKGPLTKGRMRDILVDLARTKPDEYPGIVSSLKRLGDEISTLEGISVGIDDITPMYEQRDAIMKPILADFHKAKSVVDKQQALIKGLAPMIELTKRHPGSMGEMARSGGRGNFPQLMRSVAAPVLASGDKDQVIPWPIIRSYAEGLRPSEAWAAMTEARVNEIKTRTAVSEPGDLGKILVNNMADKLIVQNDCGTRNGLAMHTDDPHIIDRYTAHDKGTVKAGTMVTPHIASELKALGGDVIVRSPMTCEMNDGLCQKCEGLDPYGRLHAIGTNIGVRAAQSMAEPLTQFALGAKHAKDLAKLKKEKTVEGVKGVEQMLQIPKSFLHAAALAFHDGTVTKIETAPQGGHYVWVDSERHYIEPSLDVVVSMGQKVESGDALSDGIPRPNEVVQYKGLGAGRKYLTDAMFNIYKSQGIEIDKRHFETMAKSILNHVRVVDTGDDEDNGLTRGDIIDYNKYKTFLAGSRKELPLEDALGETLADDVLHFTAGTRITKSVEDDLKRNHVTRVHIAHKAPLVEPFMRPAERTPLLNPDWMARLAHRFLGEGLLAGAHRSDSSKVHGTNPVPAYAFGGEFGEGPTGTY